jgi:hypothetical protein
MGLLAESLNCKIIIYFPTTCERSEKPLDVKYSQQGKKAA